MGGAGMSTDSMTSSGILVGVDGSEFSDAAVRWAAREAGLRREAVTLMTVLERKQPYIVTYDADAMLESRQSQHDEGDRILAAARQIIARPSMSWRSSRSATVWWSRPVISASP